MCVRPGTLACSRRTSVARPSGVPGERPQRARAEVAVDVAAAELRQRRAGVDDAAGHRAALGVRVLRRRARPARRPSSSSWPPHALACPRRRSSRGSWAARRARAARGRSPRPRPGRRRRSTARRARRRRRTATGCAGRSGRRPSAGFGCAHVGGEDLAEPLARVLRGAARVEGAAAVAEAEVEAPVGAEQQLAAVVVLLGLVDVEQLAQRLGVDRAVAAGRGTPPRACRPSGRTSAGRRAGRSRSRGGTRSRAGPARRRA